MKRVKLFAVLLTLLVGAGVAPAGAEPDEPVLSATGYVSNEPVPAGGSGNVAVVVSLHGDWHVNAHKPADEMLIPTTLTLTPSAAITFGDPTFPAPVTEKFGFADEPLLVYKKEFTVRFHLAVAADAEPGAREINAELRYQACDNTRCLAPRTVSVGIPIVVGAADAGSRSLHPEIFGAPAATATTGTPAATATTATKEEEPPATTATAPLDSPVVASATAAGGAAGTGSGFADRALRHFEQGSYALSFGIIFLIGLGLSFTPCVYPVIPLTVGFFAAQSEKRGGKTFGLALVYVLGMAAMYSLLGVATALTGQTFGAALGSPWVLVFLAAVMVALALSMFGVWEIGVPSVLSQRLSSSPSGYPGALFMGLTVGILAAPCIGPAIVALFTFVAAIGKVTTGLAIFFVFALGLGFPFLILGSVSGAISRLPRSGEWMVWVRQCFGFILLGLALYYLKPLLGGEASLWLGLILAVVGGVYVGFLSPVGKGLVRFRRVKAAVGSLVILLAVVGAASAMRRGEAQEISWREYEQAAFDAAVAAGKPVLLDFTAEWCVACKELERYTFTDERVKAEAARFSAFRADVTFDGKPQLEALKARYEVVGYPTVILIDSKGAERADLRVIQYVEPAEFHSRLQRVD